jgi:hypothetical protein
MRMHVKRGFEFSDNRRTSSSEQNASATSVQAVAHRHEAVVGIRALVGDPEDRFGRRVGEERDADVVLARLKCDRFAAHEFLVGWVQAVVVHCILVGDYDLSCVHVCMCVRTCVDVSSFYVCISVCQCVHCVVRMAHCGNFSRQESSQVFASTYALCVCMCVYSHTPGENVMCTHHRVFESKPYNKIQVNIHISTVHGKITDSEPRHTRIKSAQNCDAHLASVGGVGAEGVGSRLHDLEHAGHKSSKLL